MLVYTSVPEAVFNHPEGDKTAQFAREVELAARSEGKIEWLGNTPAGRGADFPTLGFQFLLDNWVLALAAAFFLGEKIDKNLTGWLSVLKTLSDAVAAIGKKFRCSADVRARALIACQCVAEIAPEVNAMQLRGVISCGQLTQDIKTFSNIEKEIPLPNFNLTNTQEIINFCNYNSFCLEEAFVFLIEANGTDLYAVSFSLDGTINTRKLG